MTESTSGLDELENRIQRRERSVRPPRKPRTEARTGSDESQANGNQQKAEAGSGPETEPTSSERQPESDESGLEEASGQSQPGEAPQQQAVDSGDKKAQSDEGGSGQDLQKLIADAIAPVVDDLQRQIADIVRKQMQEASEMNQRSAQPQEGAATNQQATQPEKTDAQEGADTHQVSTEETAAPQDRGGGQSPLRTAIQKAIAGMRQVLRWLVDTLKRGLAAVTGALRALVVKVIFGLVKMVLRAVVRGLIHRLEGNPERRGSDSDQSAPSPSSA